MTLLSDIKSARTTAGSTYSSAASAWRTAFIELAALDAALANVNVRDAQAFPVQGFGELPDPIRLRHAQFAPDISGDLVTAIERRRDEILNGDIS